MITNYKLFENLSKYKIGDYVFVNIALVDSDNFEKLSELDKKNLSIGSEFDGTVVFPAIITGFDEQYKGSFPYEIELINNDNIIAIGNDDIKRKLTDEEIETFNFKKDANKYNI